MRREASCACGGLRLAVEGEPWAVLACHCTACQRRTGSAFGLSAYFAGRQPLSLTGERRLFRRRAESGREVDQWFCPTCGTTLFWCGAGADPMAGLGVAVGCFADPAFPPPRLVAWCVGAADWVAFPDGTPRHPTQPDSLEEAKRAGEGEG